MVNAWANELQCDKTITKAATPGQAPLEVLWSAEPKAGGGPPTRGVLGEEENAAALPRQRRSEGAQEACLRA